MYKTRLGTNHSAKRRRAAVRLSVIALAVIVLPSFQNAAMAQTAPLPTPEISDLAAVSRCLSGNGCAQRLAGAESAPQPFCAADVTLRTAPELLREEVRAFAKSEPAARCDAAQKVMAPLREKIGAAYEQGSTSILTPAEVAAARNYVAACLTPTLLSNAGRLTEIEQTYLRRVTGLIVERNPQWGGPRPICTAVAIGRFIITARSCLPVDVMAQTERGAYLENIAFRFFNSPTLYGLSLREFGSAIEPALDPEHDFALLQTVGAPEMRQPEGAIPRLGTIRLNEVLYAVTTDIFLRIAADTRSSTRFDLPGATRVHHSVLCRPAHIAPDGLFLHACQMESVVTRGAPLFQRQFGQLVFVGINSGPTKSLVDRSLASCAPGLPNYGIAIPPAVIVRAIVR